jgi:hypothetical protein
MHVSLAGCVDPRRTLSMLNASSERADGLLSSPCERRRIRKSMHAERLTQLLTAAAKSSFSCDTAPSLVCRMTSGNCACHPSCA